MINQKEIKNVLHYDEHTGVFTRTFKNGKVKECKTMHNSGYIKISIDGRYYLAHRLAWVYMHGGTLKGIEIDHINNIKTDNRICNLRLATRIENQRNKGKISSNTSGLKGASFEKRRGLWRSNIKYNGVHYHLGYFKNKLDAHKAYTVKANELFGEFANDGNNNET